jgi:hypothetical protein
MNNPAVVKSWRHSLCIFTPIMSHNVLFSYNLNDVGLGKAEHDIGYLSGKALCRLQNPRLGEKGWKACCKLIRQFCLLTCARYTDDTNGQHVTQSVSKRARTG